MICKRLTGIAMVVSACLAFVSCGSVRHAQTAEGAELWLDTKELPDLVACLPAPPAFGSPEFAYDSIMYYRSKERHADKVRMQMAEIDAVWSLDTVFTAFNEPFGLQLSPTETPQIWKLLLNGISTIEQIRVAPKAYYHRLRPFEYFEEHPYTAWEEDFLRGEGSYPSGHTIRGWSIAMILTEINPDAADALFKRGWQYGESRVLVGAHWQSDVDVSRVAASIAYSRLQASPEYRKQVRKARREFQRLQAQ